MSNLFIIFAMNLIFVSVAFVCFRIFVRHEKKDRFIDIALILGTAVVAWVIAHFFKGIIMHPRPEAIHALITPDSTYSFPSGHATFMFSLAIIMYHFDKYAGKVVVILALVTGISRVLVGVHYWYDIAGGMVLGVLVSYLTVAVLRKIKLI